MPFRAADWVSLRSPSAGSGFLSSEASRSAMRFFTSSGSEPTGHSSVVAVHASA